MSFIENLFSRDDEEPEREPRKNWGSHSMKQSSNKSLKMFCRNCHYSAEMIRKAERGELDGLNLSYRQERLRDAPLDCPNATGSQGGILV